MDLFIVVSEELVFLLGCKGAQGLFEVQLRILATDHEADLA